MPAPITATSTSCVSIGPASGGRGGDATVSARGFAPGTPPRGSEVVNFCHFVWVRGRLAKLARMEGLFLRSVAALMASQGKIGLARRFRGGGLAVTIDSTASLPLGSPPRAEPPAFAGAGSWNPSLGEAGREGATALRLSVRDRRSPVSHGRRNAWPPPVQPLQTDGLQRPCLCWGVQGGKASLTGPGQSPPPRPKPHCNRRCASRRKRRTGQ